VHGDIWAEVLRRDHQQQRPGRQDRPRFYIRVYRIGTGEVARTRYYPRLPVAGGPLAAKKVTELVREALRS
jgi:hypothetical protein